jgi:tetratricopeptide (TPR) repeat protein
MKKLALTILVLLMVGILPVISLAGQLEDAQEAVRQNPNDANAHYNLGVSYAKSGRHQESIPFFKEVIRINPNFSAHYGLGVSYAKLGQYQEAIASFKEVIRINPNFAEAHYNLGLSFGRTKNGFDAITHTFIAGKLFERQNNSKFTAFAKIKLRNWFKVFPKYRPEDFANIQIPGPSSPDDTQLIIDAAKNGYLTEELHKKYWSDLRKKGGDEHLLKTLTDWYPKINRLQLNFNREMFKSLKLTLKNKKITYSSEYEASYQKMKREMFNLPFKKGTKEYTDIYRGMVPGFKKSKNFADKIFEYAITGETMTYPYDKSIKMKIDLQTVLAMEAGIEEGWKNLLKLFNPTWSE